MAVAAVPVAAGAAVGAGLAEDSSSVSQSDPLILRWIRKDGAVIWIEQCNVPIYDEAGNIIAIEGVARDITEYKRMEQYLYLIP